MSITGHQSMQEVERYTRTAEQKCLAVASKLGFFQSFQGGFGWAVPCRAAILDFAAEGLSLGARDARDLQDLGNDRDDAENVSWRS